MKQFVLDTNVLINDPLAFKKFDKCEILIPLIVVSELDGLKKRRDPTGVAARHAARELDELRDGGKLNEGVKLPSGGILRVLNSVPRPSFEVPGDKGANDHVILQNCIDNPGSILVTEDTFMRVLADALGIPVERYKNSVVEDDSMYQECRKIELPSSVINSLYQNDMIRHETDLDVNEYAVGVAGTQSVLIRGFGDGVVGKVRSSDQNVMGINSRNKEQAFLLDALLDPGVSLVAAAGVAGTGKTLLAIAAGLQQTVNPPNPVLFESVTVSRPIVSMGNEIGFLPGTLEEKMDPWMGPIWDSIEFLTGGKKNKAVEEYRERGKLEVQALTYIRGRSLPKKFILVDEAQNLSSHEVKTIITRAGTGTKLVFTGDPYQIDSPYLDQYNNGLSFIIDRFSGEDIFAHVTLHKGERSELAELAAKLL